LPKIKKKRSVATFPRRSFADFIAIRLTAPLQGLQPPSGALHFFSLAMAYYGDGGAALFKTARRQVAPVYPERKKA
jgi:hypothetical protein